LVFIVQPFNKQTQSDENLAHMSSSQCCYVCQYTLLTQKMLAQRRVRHCLDCCINNALIYFVKILASK